MTTHKSRRDADTDAPDALRRRITKFVITWHVAFLLTLADT